MESLLSSCLPMNSFSAVATTQESVLSLLMAISIAAARTDSSMRVGGSVANFFSGCAMSVLAANDAVFIDEVAEMYANRPSRSAGRGLEDHLGGLLGGGANRNRRDQLSAGEHLNLVLPKFRNSFSPMIGSGNVDTKPAGKLSTRSKAVNSLLCFHKDSL